MINESYPQWVSYPQEPIYELKIFNCRVSQVVKGVATKTTDSVHSQ